MKMNRLRRPWLATASLAMAILFHGPLFALQSNDLAQAEPQQPDLGQSEKGQTEQQTQRSLQSVKKIDDLPLFQMTYYGDYDRLQGARDRTQQIIQRQTGGQEEDDRRAQDLSAGQGFSSANLPSWACSLFVAHGDGKRPLYGRNFDWQENPAMLLFTDPSDGYASVSMVDISYLGFSRNDKKYDSVDGRRGLLDAPMIPFDGMNEHGLTVGMAAVPNSGQPFDPGKPTFHGLGIIRMVLDKAKTVDEALVLFEQYNIATEGGPQIHYLVADAGGSSALVELKDGQRHVFRNSQPWQMATNFYYCGNEHDATSQCHRYAKIARRMGDKQGNLTVDESIKLLKDVAQRNTRWSAVYDMKGKKVSLVTLRRFGRLHEFKLHD